MSIPLIVGLAVLGLIIAIAVRQRSRPRVTTIEHRRDEADKPKDDGE